MYSVEQSFCSMFQSFMMVFGCAWLQLMATQGFLAHEQFLKTSLNYVKPISKLWKINYLKCRDDIWFINSQIVWFCCFGSRKGAKRVRGHLKKAALSIKLSVPKITWSNKMAKTTLGLWRGHVNSDSLDSACTEQKASFSDSSHGSSLLLLKQTYGHANWWWIILKLFILLHSFLQLFLQQCPQTLCAFPMVLVSNLKSFYSCKMRTIIVVLLAI